MANYECAIRTNYFHVKDDEEFKEFMSSVCGYEDSVELWEQCDDNGNTVFGFGCYGGILGLEDEDEDYDYNKFIDGLTERVAEDDAILIFESGNEKLRYVVGVVEIITSKGYEYKNIRDIGVEAATKMLGNSNFNPKTEY